MQNSVSMAWSPLECGNFTTKTLAGLVKILIEEGEHYFSFKEIDKVSRKPTASQRTVKLTILSVTKQIIVMYGEHGRRADDPVIGFLYQTNIYLEPHIDQMVIDIFAFLQQCKLPPREVQ